MSYTSYESDWDILALLDSIPTNNTPQISSNSVDFTFVQEYQNEASPHLPHYFQSTPLPRPYSINSQSRTRHPVDGTKVKKPLNSYMAFRCEHHHLVFCDT